MGRERRPMELRAVLGAGSSASFLQASGAERKGCPARNLPFLAAKWSQVRKSPDFKAYPGLGWAQPTILKG